MGIPTSRELFDRYRSDPDGTATELFDRYIHRLLSLIRKRIGPRLGRRIDAEDVLQSAYRSFFVHAQEDDFQITESGDLWRLLVGISLNKLHRQIEKHQAAKRNYNREDLADLALSDARTPAATASEAIGLLEQLDLVAGNLTPDERTVMQLQLNNWSIEQIATETHKSERTIRRTLAAVLQKLQRQLILPNDIDNTQSSSAAQLSLSPLQYADYVLEQLVGSGGMGKVFRARTKATGNTVAIKALHKSRQFDSIAVHQLVQEAQILIALRHPNLIGVEGLGRFPGGGYFMVMDFVAGGDLQSSLDTGTLPTSNVMELFKQIAAAIEYAHSFGIVHCDLKPANVLLTKSGQAIVTDFGFAHLASRESNYQSAIGGTLGFIAPEVMELRSPPTPAADIYALGVMLWRLISGKVPRDPSDLDHAIEVSPSIREACQKCLATNPSHRFATVTQLLESLG